MSYHEALKNFEKVGANKAEGLPWLAAVCLTLSHDHAINPQMVYEGARKHGLDGHSVRKLSPLALGDLMFA